MEDADRSTGGDQHKPTLHAVATRAAPSDGGAQPLPRNVKLLGAASLLNDVASEIIFPLMPQFLLTVLGGNRFHLGIIEGVADCVSSLLKLWSGAWSDRAGRRKRLVVSGYLLAAVARPAVGVVTVPWQLFAARTVDRIGKGIRSSPRDALIADSSDASTRGRAFGFHRAADHFGAALGPILAAAFLLVWPGELRLLFLLTVIPGLAAVALLVYGLQEKPITESPQRVRLTLKPLGKNFRLYLIALAVFTLGNSSDAFLLVRAGELGVATAHLPLLWCAFHVVKSGGNLLAGKLVDSFGPRPLIAAGWLGYAGVYTAFGLASETWQIWVLFLIYGAFVALSEPAEKTLVTQLAGAQRKGLAFGWFNFTIGIAALPSSLIFGALYQQLGPLAAFGWGAGLAVLAALLMMAIRPAAGEPGGTT